MIAYMDYDEFKRQLGKAGLTARELGEMLKMHPNSITNYAQQGFVPSRLALIVTLMAEMADHGLDYRSVVARVQVVPSKPRGDAKGRFGGTKRIDLPLSENLTDAR